jgi:hypothetical protein
MGLDKATLDVAMQGAPKIEINNISCGLGLKSVLLSEDSMLDP